MICGTCQSLSSYTLHDLKVRHNTDTEEQDIGEVMMSENFPILINSNLNLVDGLSDVIIEAFSVNRSQIKADLGECKEIHKCRFCSKN